MLLILKNLLVNLLLALPTVKMKVVILLTAVISTTASTDRSESIVSYRFDPIIQSGDFGRVIQLISERRPTNYEKYYLLKHRFPNKGYNFPVHNFGDHNGIFRNKWLDEYSGFVYSAKDEGGCCKFCVSPGIRCTCGAATKELKKATEKLRERLGSKDENITK